MISLCASEVLLRAVFGSVVYLTMPEHQSKEAFFDLRESTLFWQGLFLDGYRGGEPGFYSQFAHDADLGWDHRDPIRPHPLPTRPPLFDASTQRIVTIGDSFTRGVEVDDDQTFAFHLERQLEHSRVINLGTAGYGIGQAFLKYLKLGGALRPHLLVFGVYEHDLERTRLPFFLSHKPFYYYDPQSEEVRLERGEIPGFQETYDALSDQHASLNRTSYAYHLLKSHLFPDKEPVFLPEMEAIAEHIFTRLKVELGRTHTQLLVLHIPSAEHIAAVARQESIAPHHERLLGLYRRLRIPYIDLSDAFLKRFSVSEVLEDLYLPSDRGQGHLSPKGHEAVAQILSEHLAQTL
ncbi:MAG: SGNH/GDSL hydrolase family protein [Myxococcota bacterium]|nr:SGNH/GDSL hydrolase family protein [Myxococcota bacterium]